MQLARWPPQLTEVVTSPAVDRAVLGTSTGAEVWSHTQLGHGGEPNHRRRGSALQDRHGAASAERAVRVARSAVGEARREDLAIAPPAAHGSVANESAEVPATTSAYCDVTGLFRAHDL